MSDLYPVTVFTSRYSCTYEGAPWIAVQAHADPSVLFRLHGTEADLNGCQSDDVTCMRWFDDGAKAGVPIGRGDTPDKAVANLAEQLGVSWQPGDDSLTKQFERALDAAHERSERDD